MPGTGGASSPTRNDDIPCHHHHHLTQELQRKDRHLPPVSSPLPPSISKPLANMITGLHHVCLTSNIPQASRNQLSKQTTHITHSHTHTPTGQYPRPSGHPPRRQRLLRRHPRPHPARRSGPSSRPSRMVRHLLLRPAAARCFRARRRRLLARCSRTEESPLLSSGERGAAGAAATTRLEAL